MADPYFGHRDPVTWKPLRDKDEWIDWDYNLVSALQIIQDNTDQNGLLRWEKENDRVDYDAERKIDKFQAAVDRRTKGTPKKPYNARPGEYFVPKRNLRGGPEPTFREYMEEIRKKAEKSKDGTIE